MSLIIGCAALDIGFLVADTLLSFPAQKYDPRHPAIERFHGLKIHILAPNVAVAFAGDVETALEMIGRLQQELAANSHLSAPQSLLDIRRELAVGKRGKFQGDCEFLVLTLEPERKPWLA